MASSPSERDRQETTMGIMFDPSKPLLFQLPKGLFVTILSDWMGLEGIHNFDSAILSHKYRESVLECLAAIRSPRLGRFGDETQRNTHSNNDVTSDDSPSFFSCSSLRWLSLRRIQVEHVNLDLVIKNENLIAPRQGLDKEVELLRDIDLPWLRSLQIVCGLNDRAIAYLVRTSPLLKSISIEYSRFWRDMHLVIQSETMRLFDNLTGEALRHIAQHCPLLEQISIDRNDLYGKRDFVEPLLALLPTCVHLTSVKLGQGILAQFDPVSLKRLQPFGNVVEQLSFDFMSYGEVHQGMGERMSTRDICDLLRHCPRLRHFTAQCSSDERFRFALLDGEADLILTTIADSCPLLLTLNINGAEGFTDEGLSALSRKCKQLKHLRMFGCHEFTNSSFQIIAQLEELECLELVKWREDWDLNSLDMSDMNVSTGMTDQGLRALADGCPMLKTLDLFADCDEDAITFETLCYFAERHCHLTQIHLMYLACGNVLDDEDCERFRERFPNVDFPPYIIMVD